jgi:hypothetical protein
MQEMRRTRLSGCGREEGENAMSDPAAKLCILCHQRPAAVPDRERMGRPIKRVCFECHRDRLRRDAEPIILRDARNILYWSADVKGFVGLAATGPTAGCRVGPKADMELRKVTCVVEVSQRAVDAWEAQPWKWMEEQAMTGSWHLSDREAMDKIARVLYSGSLTNAEVVEDVARIVKRTYRAVVDDPFADMDLEPPEILEAKEVFLRLQKEVDIAIRKAAVYRGYRSSSS